MKGRQVQVEEIAMIRKLSIAAAIAGVLLIPAVSFGEPQHKSGHVNKSANVNKKVHVNKNVNRNVRVNKNVNVNKNVSVNRNVSRNYVVGKSYNGHVWYGPRRHYWHGRWYAYGIGECWINIDGLWFWNALLCP
jgi:hypothetical protein